MDLQQTYRELLSMFYRDMDLHIGTGTKLTVGSSATRLHVTPISLSRACKQLTGHPPKYLQLHYTMQWAAEELAFGATVSTLYQQLGYANSKSFIRNYVRIIGTKPLDID
ncbi:Helix-turn-helix domain-containing protein [bacterium A37T11]|nr:Helix-turn-helix domain-containing protein [bacterium A37T11]